MLPIFFFQLFMRLMLFNLITWVWKYDICLRMLHGHSRVRNTSSFPVQQHYEILSSSLSLSHVSIGTPSTKNNCKFYTIFQMNINKLWPCSYSQFFFVIVPQRSNFHVWASDEKIYVWIYTHIDKLASRKRFERKFMERLKLES
jgi:hypothetical protein